MVAQAGELERIAAEQAALRRVATLVAEGADETELAAAVTREIGRLFGAQRAYTMRWTSDTIRAIGDWCSDPGQALDVGRVYPFGGDTVIARVGQEGATAGPEGRVALRLDPPVSHPRGLETSATGRMRRRVSPRPPMDAAALDPDLGHDDLVYRPDRR